MEVIKMCRVDAGGQAPSIFTFTPRLGIGWFVASHRWVANHRYGFPLETELVFSFIGVEVTLEVRLSSSLLLPLGRGSTCWVCCEPQAGSELRVWTGATTRSLRLRFRLS